MIANSTLFLHFWQFYFVPPSPEPWWKGAVWGNVLAILPSAPILLVLGCAGYYFHKKAIAPLHAKIDALSVANTERHDEHVVFIKSILDALDPQSEGETRLDQIADRVDEHTPGGLGTILTELQRHRQSS